MVGSKSSPFYNSGARSSSGERAFSCPSPNSGFSLVPKLQFANRLRITLFQQRRATAFDARLSVYLAAGTQTFLPVFLKGTLMKFRFLESTTPELPLT